MVRRVVMLFAVVAVLPRPADAVFVNYGTPTAAPEGNAVCTITMQVTKTGADSELQLDLTTTSGEAFAAIGLRRRFEEAVLSTGIQPGCDIFPNTPDEATLPLPESKKVKITGTMLLHAHPGTGSDKVTCIEIYGAKTDVTLTANATGGSFDKWSNDCAGTQADCKLTLDPSAQNPDKTAKAKFKK